MARSDITKYPGVAEMFQQLQKAQNEQTFECTANQDTFVLTNGSYTPNSKTINAYIEGSLISRELYTEVDSKTIKLATPRNAGDIVTFIWLEGKVPVQFGHNSTHYKGGQDELDATKLANGDILTATLGVGLLGERYPRLAGETDDAPRFNRIIADAIAKKINKVKLGAMDYYITSQTVDMSAASGLAWEGVGYDNRSNGAVIQGTQIIRGANIIAIKAIGDSVSTGGTNTRGLRFSKIRFKGGDFAEDFMQIKACAVTYMDDVMFTGFGGRALLLQESMDSRITNAIFEWGGTADGTIPMVELVSGSGYEYTNQLHITGTRFESYRGVALKTTGSNTNEIYMSNNKMESLISMQPALVLQGANTVNLGVLNICSKGTVGQTLSSQVVIEDTDGVYGLLWLEHTGTIDTTASKIDKFVDIKGTSSDIDLLVYVYQNGGNTVQSNPVMVTAADADTININGTIRNSLKAICNIHARMRNIQIKNTTPSVRLNYSVVTGWSEYWETRLNGDGTGSKYTLSHNKDGTLTDIFSVLNSGDTEFYKNVYVKNFAFHPAQLATAPYGREGSVYVDTSVTPNCTRTYSGGSWRRVGYTSAFSNIAGSWNSGDIVYNTTTAEQGTAGSKYIVAGWKRVSAGSNHVLNTDWFEMRMLTGN